MAHSQNSPRGLFAKRQITLADTSGNSVNLTSNSSGVLLSGGLQVSGLTAAKITANSTGLLIGSRYISTNTTGNATT